MQMEHTMVNKITAISGVKSASITTSVPMGGSVEENAIYAADRTYSEGAISPLRRHKWIAPGYFATMGQRILAGRDLTWPELYTRSSIALISENTARAMGGVAQSSDRETHSGEADG